MKTCGCNPSREQLLSWRGIDPDDGCSRCQGSGVRAYSSTGLWGGRCAGQAITDGICDLCWGTGSQRRPGLDLRLLGRPLTSEQALALAGAPPSAGPS